MNNNEYQVSPGAYLKRAAELIKDGKAVNLFYAALELRFFDECRQDQYLEAQEEYAKSIPKRSKVGAQGKALEAIFKATKYSGLCGRLMTK